VVGLAPPHCVEEHTFPATSRDRSRDRGFRLRDDSDDGVDGNQHGHDQARAFDAERTRALETAGWRVLRFSNAQVMGQIDSVLDTILAAIEGKL